MKGRRQKVILGALGLVVVVVTFAVVLPRIASYADVWDVVKELDTTWLLALGAAVVVNVVTYAPPWMIALPGLRFRQALPFTQASTALTYVAPGGGIVGMAGSYGLLRTWGFGSSDVARAVTLTGIWNQLANLLLPVLAVVLLSMEAQRNALLTTVAVVGASVFAVAAALLVLIFWSDALARGIGEVCERALNRILRVLPPRRRRGMGRAARALPPRDGRPDPPPLAVADARGDRRERDRVRRPARLAARRRDRLG